MSKDFEKKIEELFLQKEKLLQEQDLNLLIRDISSKLLIEVSNNKQSTTSLAKQIIDLLPKFEFNEKKVGQVNSTDRKQFEMFMGAKLKSAKELSEKINILNGFCNSVEKIQDTRSILSNLMMLKIMKNIITGSSPGVGGMQFEAFIAGLFGGVQISDESAVDVVINNKLYQVKLLQKGGSARIARKNIELLKGKELNFIIVNKISNSSLVFYSLVTKPVMADNKAEYRINSTEYTKHLIGKVDISDKAFVEYSKILQQNVLTLLTEVASLTDNINKFYFNNDTTAARDGIKNTTNIAASIKEQI